MWGVLMKIKSIIEMKKDGTYKFHVKHEDAKGLITSTEGFWDQTESPIIAVEKRKVSSKRIPHMRLDDEKEIEVALLIYSDKITKGIVDNTLTVKEIIDILLGFENSELPICCYSNQPDDPEKEWWYFDCINMYPSDDYDCRCSNIKKLFKRYHTEGFLA